MRDLPNNKKDHVVTNINPTSRYPDAILNKKNLYLEQRVSQIYLAEIQLNKANSFGTKFPFWDSILLIAYLYHLHL